MAEEKKNSGKLLYVSPNFLSQLGFGLFLSVLLSLLGFPGNWSIFLGVSAGFILGWVAAASENSPRSQNLASSEGIEAGLKYWLFFMLGLVLVGYRPNISILIGGIAGIAGGWIITWWKSKEETKTELPTPEIDSLEKELTSRGQVTRPKMRKTTQRYRRSSSGIKLKFWER
ncbi:hypothetical protein [Calothrix rhizosoleniae]|uniref:hypothetical protein n=1 Tax=Calothrix rhizosoleniae TaxID=888997 RepID=UPI000B496FE8|nr:hypothetical protein [Calothrix rhizosoleniae]